MPYYSTGRLPFQRASHLGHLDVLNSDLVKKLCQNFEDSKAVASISSPEWEQMPASTDSLPIIFGIDGSLQAIESETSPHKAVAFVKTALLRLDQYAVDQIDRHAPNPFALRDLLQDAAMYHATVFPLRNVSIPGMTVYDAVRQIIFESFKDASLQGEVFETLKWIVYEKWGSSHKDLPQFECPICGLNKATLPYDAETGTCPTCNGNLFLTDMLGFHLEMSADAASDSIATAYMNIHETCLLFTGIRYFWENNRSVLPRCLFVKDGPLSIRAQYSKIVGPIRRFLTFAAQQGYPVHIIGQEKSGSFVDHLQLIGKEASGGQVFIPGNKYITASIQHRPQNRPHRIPYGIDTNYGAKVFVKFSEYHQMVLNIPTGSYKEEPKLPDLIGFERICSTLPRILSNRYEGALLPIELAHGIASLSTYPSAQILKIFSGLDL